MMAWSFETTEVIIQDYDREKRLKIQIWKNTKRD